VNISSKCGHRQHRIMDRSVSPPSPSGKATAIGPSSEDIRFTMYSIINLLERRPAFRQPAKRRDVGVSERLL
jgi:hypothetical protein